MPRRIVAISAAIAALVLGAWLGASGVVANLIKREPPALEAATLLPEPRTIGSFELAGHDGQPFTRRRLEGHWTFLFMGYTHCPDICPVTLTTLDAVSQALAGSSIAQDTSYLFVSVDPRRDTPPRLKEYVTYFNPSFLGATGDPSALERLGREVSLPFFVPDEPAQKEYLVGHSAAIALIGPKGRLQARFPAPHDARQIADAYRKIRAYRSG